MMFKTNPKVSAQRPSGILLLGTYRPTTPLARWFSASGYHVICGARGDEPGAGKSRYVDEIWDHLEPSIDLDGFMTELTRFLAERPQIKYIVPVSESFCRIFAADKRHQNDHCKLVMMNERLVDLCLDKEKLLKLAGAQEVPVAPFATVHNITDMRQSGDRIGFPLVVRPLQSTKRLWEKKAVLLESAQDLQKTFAIWPEGHDGLLIQRRVSGERHNVYFGARAGKITAIAHSKILRTDRADGSGLAVEGITLDSDQELETYCERVISALKYEGIGCAQFLVDETTGEKHFLEINPRVAGNHLVPEQCGLDLTGILFGSASKKTIGTPAKIRGKSNLRYSWFAGDLQGIKMAWIEGEAGVWTTLCSLGRALRTFARSDIDMTLNLSDPIPGIISLCQVVPGLRALVTNAKPPSARFSNREQKTAMASVTQKSTNTTRLGETI